MSKNRNRKVSETVIDNHSYHIKFKETELGCSWCHPHQGCNGYATKRRVKRAWKSNRSTQWKEVSYEC